MKVEPVGPLSPLKEEIRLILLQNNGQTGNGLNRLTQKGVSHLLY
jgi:hypothetical protein